MLVPILAAVVAASAPSAAPAAQEMQFGYCKASELNYGRYHLFSTVFQVPYATYHVGVQNSFDAFAGAYDGRTFGSAICSINYDSWQEAEDAKNRWIARHRQDGHAVALARWSYRGD
ncbi:hypothetical protein GCM10009116_21320 [Brevundimonas basaltis]|uniref:Uncharacterized protein n=1 Tax=Brevundimonas basaltis TaxID=472166 RepID=A0A7W8HXT8_9CAUL|nr:hypothetical protein [Brevundimonas basaltis]MBB5291881.1 hypothetical protein [Brevundimonas basaltis]